MRQTTEKIEATKAHIAQTEQRILRQRRRVEKMLAERHPAEDAQAQLLIMEQSLIAMTRYLKTLIADLERRLGTEQKPTRKPRKSHTDVSAD